MPKYNVADGVKVLLLVAQNEPRYRKKGRTIAKFMHGKMEAQTFTSDVGIEKWEKMFDELREYIAPVHIVPRTAARKAAGIVQGDVYATFKQQGVDVGKETHARLMGKTAKKKKKKTKRKAGAPRPLQMKSATAVGGFVEVLADDQESADAIADHIESEIRKGKLGDNPMPRKKKIRRGKATPAQLRALKKAHAALRKKRAAKKKTRRNPAYNMPGYAKARQAARGTGTRRANPVRKLAPVFAIKSGARYFDGVRFSAKVSNAARFATLAHCKNVAQKIADATGKTCAIVNLRK